MKAFTGHRQRTFYLWLARLALFAYAFQLSAVDHIHNDITNIQGVVGTSFHEMHCHVDVGSCAEQPGFMGSLAEQKLMSLPVGKIFEAEPHYSWQIPTSAFRALEDKPPRAI